MLGLWLAAAAAAISISPINAHPGESWQQKRAEAKARGDYLASLENTDLAHCKSSLTSRGVVERTIERRRAIFDEIQTQEPNASGMQGQEPSDSLQQLMKLTMIPKAYRNVKSLILILCWRRNISQN